MKLDRTSYLELVVRHKDSNIDEFPSRFCILRVPLIKIDYSSAFPIDLSLGQIRKLENIGYLTNANDYLILGHRPFDKNYLSYLVSEFGDQFDFQFKYSIFKKTGLNVCAIPKVNIIYNKDNSGKNEITTIYPDGHVNVDFEDFDPDVISL